MRKRISRDLDVWNTVLKEKGMEIDNGIVRVTVIGGVRERRFKKRY